jgi:hypothetical protein
MFIFVGLISTQATSDYKDPTSKTNVNSQTDLFDKSVENWQDLERAIEVDKSDTTRFQSSSNGSPVGMQHLSETITKDINSTKSDLSRIRANDLEERARSKLLEEDLENAIFIDESSPLYMEHQKDAELIANGTGNLMSTLLSTLKENFDIDCKTEKGNTKEEPQYYMDIKKETVKNTIYNKTICEELKNQYTCHDTLMLKCNQVIAKPSYISLGGTNLPILEQRIGYARFGSYDSHWINGGRGTSYDYYVSFNVVNPENIQYFTLGSINYDDFVLITINGHYIWSGPMGGQVLDFAAHNVPFGFRRVIIDHSGNHHSAENNTWFHASLNLNLKPYLKSGANTLNIRLIVGGKGGLLFDLHMADRECNHWSETWDEAGILN